MGLKNWHVGETKKFSGTVLVNDSPIDISGDTVTIRLKSSKSDSDANAVMSREADVATGGLEGVYYMTITRLDTSHLEPGRYFYDIELARYNGDEYILESGRIGLLERVSDVYVTTTTTTSTTTTTTTT